MIAGPEGLRLPADDRLAGAGADFNGSEISAAEYRAGRPLRRRPSRRAGVFSSWSRRWTRAVSFSPAILTSHRMAATSASAPRARSSHRETESTSASRPAISSKLACGSSSGNGSSLAAARTDRRLASGDPVARESSPPAGGPPIAEPA